ncbi:MAG: hypothetical protein EOP84_03855 [Verrucomicrobiaceae bacterium]|nr:MAG: hypothetical protein EOP84_03855 [Verrucomicrobiaceae bacterium]
MADLPPPTRNDIPPEDLPFAVARILERLGSEAVLLPIPYMQKGPHLARWQERTLGDMRDPLYVESLALGNIGVLLGRASGGLCTIDIDDDSRIDEFLELNPLLQATLRTRGARGCQLWLQMIGGYPELKAIKTVSGEKWGEWRADGGQSVIHGTHPTGCQYLFVVDAKPLAIEFDQIVWPADLRLPWRDEEYRRLKSQLGEPIYLNGKSGVGFNEPALASLYCRETQILFEPKEEKFYRYDGTTGLWQRTTEAVQRTDLALFLKAVTDRAGAPQAGNKITAGLLSAICSMIKGNVEKVNPFASRPGCIHVANGVIDLERAEPGLFAFHPEFFSRNRNLSRGRRIIPTSSGSTVAKSSSSRARRTVTKTSISMASP